MACLQRIAHNTRIPHHALKANNTAYLVCYANYVEYSLRYFCAKLYVKLK